MMFFVIRINRMKPQRINAKMKFTFIILFYLFIATLFSKVNFAQDEIIKVDTNLITVPAIVFDREGRYVASLKKEDFQIFEDGVEQEIAYFETVEQPFTILFLLDTSGSMNSYLPDLARASNVFMKQLRPNDQLIVASFADKKQIQILLEATKIRDMNQKIVFKRRTGDGFTATFDAVDRSIEYINNFQGRRAIVLFSDGEQNGIKSSAKSNLHNAEEQEALIYTIRFGVLPTHQPGYTGYLSEKSRIKLDEKVNNYMQGLAQKTGGRSYQVEDISNLDETFKMVAEELGQQYSLGYYPKSQGEAGQKRQIKVKMRQPNLAVRARDSYIVESSKKRQK